MKYEIGFPNRAICAFSLLFSPSRSNICDRAPRIRVEANSQNG